MKVDMDAVEVPKRKKRKKVNKSSVKAAPPSHRGTGPAARARRKGVPCGRCNKDHVLPSGKPSCNGHKRKVRPYEPCNKPPVKGAAVCRLHGALIPAAAARANERVAWERVQGEVGDLLAQCDLPEQHPIDGLLEVVRHSGAMMRLLGTLCAQLDLDPGEIKLSYNDKGDAKKYTSDDNAIFGYNAAGDQATHVLVTMYGMWADRYARACKLALDANIDERLVRNAENTTNAVYVAIQRTFDEVKMPQDMVEAFGLALAKNLRKLAGPLDDLQRKAIGA